MKQHECKSNTRFVVDNLSRALIAFFILGIGMAVGLAVLGVGLVALRGYAVAASEGEQPVAVIHHDAKGNDSIEATSSPIQPEVKSDSHPVGAKEQESAAGRAIIESFFASLRKAVPKSEAASVRSEVIEEPVAVRATVAEESVREAEKAKALPPIEHETIAQRCQVTRAHCIDLCPGGSAVDLGFEDDGETCEHACRDGHSRCLKASAETMCKEFVSACRYRCRVDAFTEDCEDACDVAEAECSPKTSAG